MSYFVGEIKYSRRFSYGEKSDRIRRAQQDTIPTTVIPQKPPGLSPFESKSARQELAS